MDDDTFDARSGELRCYEVITGTGRRRRWPAEVKARIVAESFASGVPTSVVARRHGLSPQQLFGWRRASRIGGLAKADAEGATFVPLLTSCPDAAATARSAVAAGWCVEIELRGVVVRVRSRIEAGALAEVLVAVKSIT